MILVDKGRPKSPSKDYLCPTNETLFTKLQLRINESNIHSQHIHLGFSLNHWLAQLRGFCSWTNRLQCIQTHLRSTASLSYYCVHAVANDRGVYIIYASCKAWHYQKPLAPLFWIQHEHYSFAWQSLQILVIPTPDRSVLVSRWQSRLSHTGLRHFKHW